MMQDKGLSFNAEGPIMEGTWWNPTTGHKFTVLESFFQDGQFMVQTTDGQLLDYNTIQSYVQCTDQAGHEVAAPSKPVSNTPAALPADIADLIIPEDDITGSHGLGNLADRGEVYNPAPKDPSKPQPVMTVNPDSLMVERVLRKHELPKMFAMLDWNAPVRQIDTLVNILGVDVEALVEYYMDLLDQDAIRELVKASLTEYIVAIANGQDTPKTTTTRVPAAADVNETTPKNPEHPKPVKPTKPAAPKKTGAPKKSQKK